MKIILVSDGMVDGDENFELIEDIEEDWERYLPLSGRFQINEYDMMEEFVRSLPEGKKQNILADAICGRGAFRRFKDEVYDIGLEEKWYRFRDKCYEVIAIEWCNKNEIEIIKEKR